MGSKFRLLAVAILFSVAPFAAHADTVAVNTGGTSSTNNAYYIGQAFTAGPGTTFNNIVFSFYDQGLHPFAAGTGFLFSTPYLGTPAGLMAGDAGLIGIAAASGGAYDFASTVTLFANQPYYFYENALVPTGGVSGGDVIAGSSFFFTPNVSSVYGNVAFSANFIVTGTGPNTSPVPEPSSLVLLGTGLVAAFGAARRKLMV